MPFWTIVALAARAARHVQSAIGRGSPSDCKAVDDAIQVAEDAARSGRSDERAIELSNRARQVAEEAAKRNEPIASFATLSAACAAQSASPMNTASLLAAAEKALEFAYKAIRPEKRTDFDHDIEQAVRLTEGSMEGDAAPAGMLDFVHRQAVHEAGHAVAACYLGILFTEAAILYEAGVNPVRTPCDPAYSSETRSDFSDENCSKYRLFYAAGAAGEDLIFAGRREWACTDDRRCHGECDGTDFNGDVFSVTRIRGFTRSAVLKVAAMLEDRHVILYDDVEGALIGPHGG